MGARHADHGGLGHRAVRDQHGLDIGRINVLSPGDDHVLFAVDDIEIALGVDPPDVAGAQPPAVLRVDPGGLGIGVRPIVVTQHGDVAASDDLAAFAYRGFAIRLVEDAQVRAGQGFSDRGEPLRGGFGFECGDHTLGQAIEFNEITAEIFERARFQRQRERRSAAHDRPQRAQVGAVEGRALEHALHDHRHEGGVGGLVAGDARKDADRVELAFDDHRATDQHAAQQADPADVGVEADRNDRHGAALVAQRYREAPRPLDASPVRVHDAFRQAGGPRAVDDVARRFRVDRLRRDRLGECGFASLAPARIIGPRPVGRLRGGFCAHPKIDRGEGPAVEAMRVSRHGDDRGGAAVGDHGGDRGIGDRGIERHHASPGAQYAEHGLDHLEAIRHQHDHPRAGRDVRAAQGARHATHPGGKVLPRQPLVAADQRRAFALPTPLRIEQIGQQHPRRIEMRDPVHRSPLNETGATGSACRCGAGHRTRSAHCQMSVPQTHSRRCDSARRSGCDPRP